jgi:phosphate transport system substrate-binding protein
MTSLMRAAFFAALVFYGHGQAAWAQDVTLTSRDGALAISGQLQGFDGEFYRIESDYGLLTVDGQSVICDGPACPDLTAPRATIRVQGSAELGATLMPDLIGAFAASKGLTVIAPASADGPTLLQDPATAKTLAEFSFQPADPAPAREALAAGRAELVLAAASDANFGSRTIGLDPLVAIAATDNPLGQISTAALAKALTGEVKNWADLGGPDMPLVLHGLAEETDLNRALAARLGRKIAADIVHDTPAALAAAVGKDPWALAITGRSVAGPAQVLGLTDSCGFPLSASAIAVKAEDYPLTMPVYFLTPRRRLPLMAREFLEFLSLPAAQTAIEEAGLVGRGLAREPLQANGQRLVGAIMGASEEASVADLKRLVALMQKAERLSFTFRFEDGTTTLDPHSRDTLADLVKMIEAGVLDRSQLVLAGFSDGSGAAAANLDLSVDRATQVLTALSAAMPDLPADRLPRVEAFGEILPMACDETSAGRRLNRRVELWALPVFKDSPTSGN